MGIGVTKNFSSANVFSPSPRGQLLADRLATPGMVVYPSLQSALQAGESVIQGDPKAVSPMADAVLGTVAPPIPGGLQMEKSVVVLPVQPVRLTPPAKKPTPF